MLTTTPATNTTDWLTALFFQAVGKRYKTRLVAGGDEPFYQPVDDGGNDRDGDNNGYHHIIFTRDYIASALHEVAHWCVAGPERRLLPDYGYWYAPDGRTAEQQRQFERVEVKPQALEWLFCVAAQRRFRVSADNLEQGLGPSDDFKQAIWLQAQSYCREGVNNRAHAFITALAHKCGVIDPFNPAHYSVNKI